MGQNAAKPRFPKIGRDARNLIATIAGGILLVSLTAAYTWFGPDANNVIRASSPNVPNLSLLSKEETVAALEKLAINQSYNTKKIALELSEDGALKVFRKSDVSDYESTTVIPLSQLDKFFYAEQRTKGEPIWNITVFCASYQQCINGSNNRSERGFTLNADTILWIEPHGDVLQIIGLFNQLLELHGAQGTIDTSKNTIRISEEHWRHSLEDVPKEEP